MRTKSKAKAKATSGGGKKQSKPSMDGQSKTGSKLQGLFEDQLKDIYWAEKALTKAIPKMIKNATSEELVEALENHLEETDNQVARVEEVFEILEKRPQAKKCEAMEGLIKEAEELMKENEEGVIRDAAIISAAQKVEHYEIATYGTLRTYAQTLGMDDIAEILESILEEEKNADETLTEVAETAVNLEAAGEPEGDDEEEEEEDDEESEDEEGEEEEEEEEEEK